MSRRAKFLTISVASILALAATMTVVIIRLNRDVPVAASDSRLGVQVATSSHAVGGDTVRLTEGKLSDITYDGFSKPIADRVIHIDGGDDGVLHGDATITFDLPEGTDPDEVVVYTYDKQIRKAVPVGGVVDVAARTITVTTRHFSDWWLASTDLSSVYTQEWLREHVKDAILDPLRRIAQVPPPLDCHPALTLTVKVDTAPDTLDVCPMYSDKGELQVSVGNALGAPLQITHGPGVTFGSIEPEEETAFNSLVSFYRREAGDETVALGGGRRATFAIDPTKVKNNEIHLSAKIDVGYAVLAFSGGLLETILPGLGAGKPEEVFKKVSEATNYVSCVLTGAQQLGARHFTTAGDLFASYATVYGRCEGNLAGALEKFFNDPVGSALYGYVKAVINELPKRIAKLVGRAITVLANVGDTVTQPFFTAVARYQSHGQPYDLRLAVTDPPIDQLYQLIPHGPTQYDPRTDAGYVIQQTEQFPMYALDRGCGGDPAWNTAWVMPSHANGIVTNYDQDTALLHSHMVNVGWVPPEHRSEVASVFDYYSKNNHACSADTALASYVPSTLGQKYGKYTITWNTTVFDRGQEIHEAEQWAYDPKRGYLFYQRTVPYKDLGVNIDALDRYGDRQWQAMMVRARYLLGLTFVTSG